MRTLAGIFLIVVLAAAAFAADENSLFIDQSTLSKYTRSYDLEDGTITAGFVPYKTEVVAGEPILISLYAKAATTNKKSVPLACELEEVMRISVKNASGEPVERQPGFGMTHGWEEDIEPGKVLRETFSLDEYVRPLSPGTYTVSCMMSARANDIACPIIRTEFTILVNPPDATALGMAIEGFGSIAYQAIGIESKPYSTSDFAVAANALLLIDDNRIIVQFDKILKRGFAEKDRDRQSQLVRMAANGLSKFPSDEIVSEFWPLLHDQNRSDLRSDGAQCLGRFKWPLAVSMLAEALDDRDQNVQGDIILALGRLGDRSVVEKIRPFLKSSNSQVVLYAVNALTALGEQPEMSWYDPIFTNQYSNQYGPYEPALRDIGGRWGAQALPYLASKLRTGEPCELNREIVRQISEISGQKFDYRWDSKMSDTDREVDKHTIKKIQTLWPQ